MWFVCYSVVYRHVTLYTARYLHPVIYSRVQTGNRGGAVQGQAGPRESAEGDFASRLRRKKRKSKQCIASNTLYTLLRRKVSSSTYKYSLCVEMIGLCVCVYITIFVVCWFLWLCFVLQWHLFYDVLFYASREIKQKLWKKQKK